MACAGRREDAGKPSVIAPAREVGVIPDYIRVHGAVGPVCPIPVQEVLPSGADAPHKELPNGVEEQLELDRRDTSRKRRGRNEARKGDDAWESGVRLHVIDAVMVVEVLEPDAQRRVLRDVAVGQEVLLHDLPYCGLRPWEHLNGSLLDMGAIGERQQGKLVVRAADHRHLDDGLVWQRDHWRSIRTEPAGAAVACFVKEWPSSMACFSAGVSAIRYCEAASISPLASPS